MKMLWKIRLKLNFDYVEQLNENFKLEAKKRRLRCFQQNRRGVGSRRVVF